jgi:hypothetical protein
MATVLRPARRPSIVELAYQGLEAEARAARKKKPDLVAEPEAVEKVAARRQRATKAGRK